MTAKAEETDEESSLSSKSDAHLDPLEKKMYELQKMLKNGQQQLLVLEEERKNNKMEEERKNNKMGKVKKKKKKKLNESSSDESSSSNESRSDESSISNKEEKVITRRKKNKFVPTKESNSERRKRISKESMEHEKVKASADTSLLIRNNWVDELAKDTKLITDSVIIGDTINKVKQNKCDMITKSEEKKGDTVTKSKSKKINSSIKKINKIDDSKWDIVVNKKQEWRIQNKKLRKVEEEAVEVLNHRKAKGYHGEMLVLYTTEQREWCYLHGVLQEIPDKVTHYMNEHKLVFASMGYENDDPLFKRKEEEDETEDTKYNDDEIMKTLLYSDEENDNESKKIETNNIKDINDEPMEMETNTNNIINIKDNDNEETMKTDKENNDTINIKDNDNEIMKTNTDYSTETIISDVKDNNDEPTETTIITEVKKIADDGVFLGEESSEKPKSTTTNENDKIFKCNNNHEKVLNLQEESNSKYCVNGYDFDGIHCANQSCNKKFVDKIKGTTNSFKPTGLKPMYCCANRSQRCPYALCYDCYCKFVSNNSLPIS